MSHEQLIEQLVQEALDNDLSAEDVCAEHPELLCEVLEQLRQCRKVEAQLEAIFPSSHGLSSGGSSAAKQLSSELPKIPGYEIEAILGRGGMGVVYKARHVKLNRPVALKMLLAGIFAARPETARFLREAEAVAALRHPNVVQIYDMGDCEGRPFFTMEFMEGGTLAAKLAGAPQRSSEAADLIIALAGAVDAAHQAGIVHRDLKPSNILLSANGIPKIADFGLARPLEEESLLTLTGTRVGTPSYMAPEQALGKASAIGRPADIYALGAILYEMLTGRPPFRGETASDTERQVISQDPVPPSRLNPKVPRDIETICLKCLGKDPKRRYAAAAALAEDLTRFQRNEPILARPAGVLERIAKWVRRHPTLSAVLAASFVLALVLVGGGWWVTAQHAATSRTVEKDLDEAARLRKASNWDGAQAALDRAKDRLGTSGSSRLHHRLDQVGRNLDLVARLDAVRLDRATLVEGRSNNANADRDYEAVSRNAAIGQVHEDPAVVAARVAASDVRETLVEALDDWAVCAADKRRQSWLLEVARRADPDPWRDRVRDPAAWGDQAALAELARTANVEEQPVHLLMALGERLQATGGEATWFLRRVQLGHPTDFWANFSLATALDTRLPDDAISYYRAALAIRPRAVAVHYNLGDALRATGRRDEAIEHYRWVIRNNPQHAWAQTSLGIVLEWLGRRDEALFHYQQAMDYYRQALRTDPDNFWAHLSVGIGLQANGRLDEALDHFRQAVVLDPKNRTARARARAVLLRQGRGEEARLAWRALLESNPPDHLMWYAYAELCLFLGDEDEYRRARQALLARFGESTDPIVAARTGLACLFLPASEDELRKAVALIDRAVAADQSTYAWAYPDFLFAKALADYRRGRLDSAIALLEGEASKELRPAPRLVLAMAQHRRGQREEARITLAAAVLAFDWSPAEADNHRAWMRHVLRREAEALVLPNLPAFLEGTYQPQDNDERLALLGVCQFKDLRAAMAGLYADAFAADPKLAEDLRAGQRYKAARAAAVAGCGGGADGANVEEEVRAHWRKKSREWLQADLDAWVQVLDANPDARRGVVRTALAHWREDSELSYVRDSGELNKLAPDERKEFDALWTEVAAILARTKK